MLSQFVIIDEGSSVHDNTLHVLGACNNNNLATLGSDEWRNKFTCLWTYISLQRDFCPGSYFQRNPIHTELQSWIKCAQYMPGQFQCDNYLRPVFTLTSFELVQRTFAILSCILLGIALILMLVGMETSKIFLREENVHIKMKLMKVRFLQIPQFPKPYRPAPGVFADRLGHWIILVKPQKAPRFWYLQQHSCCCTMHRHLLRRFPMSSFTISFIQRLELGHGWVLCAIRVELPYII